MNGINPNGDWYLFVQDDKPLDTGAISNGWSITLTTANPVGTASDNQTYSYPSISSVNLGANWYLSVAVTNYGPSSATNVVVNDTLPAGLSLVSAIPTAGAVLPSASLLQWSVGNLATNQGAVLNLVFSAPALGGYTNSATVSTGSGDPNPDDDTTIAAANVVVLSPPVVSNVTFSGGVPTFTITNASGAVSVIIQATTNLVAPINWTSISTNNTPFTFTDVNATNYPVRFYRSIIGP
jgi:uncharacterized repeat protein (TIGR01451 family)